MDFLAGFYVFPGGGVRENDWSEEMLGHCRGLSRAQAQQLLGGELSPELSLGHCVAAIRELFEEVGILLTITETGNPLNMRDEEIKRRLWLCS